MVNCDVVLTAANFSSPQRVQTSAIALAMMEAKPRAVTDFGYPIGILAGGSRVPDCTELAPGNLLSWNK